jgi:hypothetical protein
MPWPLVCVRWLDSSSPNGWHRLKTWGGVHSMDCVSVGYLIEEDDRSKTIAPHIAFPGELENRQGAGIMVIPAGAIVSVETLSAASRERAGAVAGRSSRSRGRGRKGS